jgi:hypothetical protein
MGSRGRGLDLSLPIDSPEAQTLLSRLGAQTTVTDSCWLWTGYKRNALGHGALSVHDRPVWVHRLAYALTYGPIAPDAVICHRCDVPACVRPDHLFIGTQADNVADMERKGRARKVALQGEAHPQAHLSDVQVGELRALHAGGLTDQRALAARFGVSQSTVWRLVHRMTRAT